MKLTFKQKIKSITENYTDLRNKDLFSNLIKIYGRDLSSSFLNLHNILKQK